MFGRAPGSGQLANRLLAFQRFQCDLGLEDAAAVSTFLISFVSKIGRQQIAAYVSARVPEGSSPLMHKCYQSSGIKS